MGFYSQIVFPRLCDFALDTPAVAKNRQELLAAADGEILEIGFGTGLNLPHYPAQVRKITAVDPSTGMHRRAQKRIRQSAIEVDHRALAGERLPFDDGSFACIVSTFTLCSIDDVGQALREIFRVLKPKGRLLFLEHGLSSEPNVQKWQRRLNWLQMRLGAGCRLVRDMRALVAAQPFSTIDIETSYLEKTPKTHGYLYRGTATK